MSEPILPDADAAYLINHWERLSPVDQEAARKRLRIWKAAKDQRQQEKALDLEAAYLDGDAAFDARQPALKARFETSEDRQRFRQVAYISTLTGHDPRKVAMDLPGYQRAVAERAWKTPEAGVSPQAFETEAKRRMQKQRDFRHLLEGEPEKPKSLPASPVTVMPGMWAMPPTASQPGKPAEEAKPAGLMPLLQKAWSDAIEGRDGTIGFIDWQAAAQSDPRYDHKRLSQFSEVYFRAYDATHRAMEEVRPAVNRIMEGFRTEQERSGSYGGDALIAEVQGVSKEARPALYALLQTEAAKVGKDKPAGGQLLQAFGRGGVGMLVGTSRTMAASELDATEQFLATLKPGDEIGGRFIAPGDKPGDALMRVEGPNGAVESALTRWIFEPLLTNKTITQADIDAAKAKVADQRDKLGINLQLEQIAKGQFDPIKGGNWLTEKVIYPVAESFGPQVALAALTRRISRAAVEDLGSVRGLALLGDRGRMALSMTYGAGSAVPLFGMLADQNAQQLMAQNPGMGLSQAYKIGREAAYAQTGLEYLQSVLALGALPKFSKALEHARANAWANFGKGLLVQGVEQNLIEGVQDILPPLVQALHSDAPGVNWDKVLGEWASTRADTFWAVLPAVIFGAGGEAYRAKQSRPQLEALAAGITDPMQLKAAGFNASDIAVITAEKDIDAQLEKFTAAMWRRSEAVAKQGRAELDARTTAVETLQREGALPSFRRTAEGFEVLAGDKLVGKAATAQEALQLGALHSDAMAAMSGEAVAYMASQLQAIDLARNMGAQGESSSITEFRPDEVRTVAQEIAEDPNAEARVLAQMQAQDAIDGTEGTAEVVFGSSETTFQNGVRMTVNRLYAGSSVLVVFHEETHGFYRDALARGRLTRETTEQFLRTVDTVLAGRTDKQGRQLRLLPEGEATPEAIDEAVSELMEAEILRTRKTLPDGIVSKNLSAIAKLAPEAARQFGAFVRVVRQYWGRVFGRSLAIRKGLKSGAIDSTAYAEFFDKLLGTDGAAAHEQAAVEAANEILGDPFSLGYHGAHRPNSDGPRAFALDEEDLVPADVYDHPEWYSGMEPAVLRETMAQLRRVKGKPDGILTIWRAAPAGEFNSGDWVTLSPTYARQHSLSNSGDDLPVWSARVPAKDVRWAMDDLAEFGYFGEKVAWEGTVERSYALAGANAEMEQFRRDALDTARAMAAEGKSSEEIRALTGWFPGKYDGKMRWEIPDKGAAFEFPADAIEEPREDWTQTNSATFYLGDVFVHPALFAAYPEARGIKLTIYPTLGANGQFEEFDGKGFISLRQEPPWMAANRTRRFLQKAREEIDADAEAAFKDGTAESVEEAKARLEQENARDQAVLDSRQIYSDSVVSTLLHEIQHWIQRKEGFAKGGNSDAMRKMFDFVGLAVNRANLAKALRAAADLQDKLGEFSNETVSALPEAQINVAFGAYNVTEERWMSSAELRQEAQRLDEENINTDLTGYEAYRRLAGEIEARDVQARQSFTAEQRAAVAPYSSENIAPGDAIVSFSIGHRQQLNALVTHAASRIRDPKQKAAVYSRMIEKLNALRRDTSRIIRAFGKDFQTATLSEEKTLARIRQEKSAWRDARIAELVEQEMTPEQMQAIDLPADVLDARQYPVTDSVMRRVEYTAKRNGKTHRVVTLRGTLLSRSAARNAGGEYDIPNGVPSYVFGGTVEPDVAAQQAGFDSTDDFWEALAQEAQTAAGLREQMQKAKEAMKAIEAQAKADADEWEAAQIRQQRRDYSPRAKIIRALGMLDGIIASVPMEVRGKIGGFVQLAKLGTDEKRLEFLQERLAKVEEVVERHFQKEFTGDLNKLLERAKPQKNAAGEKPKGKLGPIGHALFEIADRAREMDAAGVAGLLAELQARLDSGELTGEQQAEVQAQMEIAQLVGDWKHADSARMAEAVAALDGAFGDHWLTWQKRIKQRAETREAKKKEGIALTGKAGTPAERRERFEADNGIVGKVKDFFLGFGSFGDVVRFAFGDGDFSNEWIDRERKASQAKEDANQAFAEEVDGVFADLAGSSYQGQLLRWRLSRPTIDGGKAGIISELEAMQAVLMGRQEDGRRHLEAFGYDAEWLQSMEEALSPEGAAVLDWMADTYAAEYERLNAVYRERQGVNLPRHSNYAPLTVKPAQAQGGEMVDPVTGGTVAGVSSTPGFLRTRSRIAKAEPEFRDALATLIAHRQALEHWIAYGDLANDLGAIYRDRDFGNAVEAAGGKEAISELRKWVDVFTLGGLRDAATTLAANQALGRWTARAASMALIGRLSVVLVQATQLGAAVAQMPVGSYVFRLAKLLSGQLNWSAALQSDFVRRRLEQTPPFVRQALEGLRSGRPNRIKWAMHAMGRAISGADAIFTAGTYAIIYDFQLKQALKLGLRGEEASNRAANEAERLTEEVAQPTRMGARSLFEVTHTSPLARMTWAFASEARQKLALMAWAVRNARNDPARVGRVAMVVWLAGGLAAQVLRNIWRDAKDDDEFGSGKYWSIQYLAAASLGGPANGVPVLGSMIQDQIDSLFGVPSLPNGPLVTLGGAPSAAKRLVTLESFEEGGEWLNDLESVMRVAGMFNDTAAALTAAGNIVTDAEKVMTKENKPKRKKTEKER